MRPFAEPAAGGTRSDRAGGQWQVSTAGGIYPLWRFDTKELYYIDPDSKLMAAPIETTSATLEPGTPATAVQKMAWAGNTTWPATAAS